MDKWKSIRKRYIILEAMGILGIVFCFLVGLYCDWDVLKNSNIVIPMNDIESFSLTILQIQATVGTLIIAIIALITGNISDSYMGVSISDFYLNIKPWKLKQKVLIFISLGLCLIGAIFHTLKLYNMVFGVFVGTLIATSISIIEIYSAFRGKKIENEEIEAYINYIMDSNADFIKKENIFRGFVSDWKELVDSQDKQSHEKYYDFFQKCMLTLLEYETEEGVNTVQQLCYSMSYCLLGSDKSTTKERGIEFLQCIYDVLWSVVYKSITERKPILNRYRNEFPLFAEISSQLLDSVEELSAEDVEKRLKFGNLADSVQRIAIWFKYDQNDVVSVKDDDNEYKKYKYNYSSEIRELNIFAQNIGYYLKKQQSKNNIINQYVWAKQIVINILL